jgi:hypothetical protein
MRSILLLAFLPACLVAAPALGIVKPAIAQSDGGDAVPAGFTHTAGETMFFSCNIAGFTKSPEEQIHLTYSVQAFDPKGVPVAEIYKNEVQEEVGPQDKDWQPKVETEIVLPDILRPGAYKIVVKAEDLLAKTSADLTVPFQVAGLNVPASATLVVAEFHWFHHEDDQRAMSQPLYHAGDDMYMKYDVTGFKYGQNNKVDVSCVASLVLENGKTIWTQPEPATEQSEAFYPKPYVTGEFGITLQKDFKPGTYNMQVSVKDAVGKQTFEKKFQFIVQ